MDSHDTADSFTLRYGRSPYEIPPKGRRCRRRLTDSDSDSDSPRIPIEPDLDLVDAAADKPAQELVKLDPAEIGMSVGCKYFYSGKEDKRGRFQWQSQIPEDLGKPAEDAESEKWAVVVRKVKVFNDSKKVLQLHSIVVQSPLLKEVLKEVLAGYPGVTVELNRLEFSGKFEPLIHRWVQYRAAVDALEPGDKKEHAIVLRDLIEEEFKEELDACVNLRNEGVMTFEYIWTLFHPGTLVFSKHQGQDRIFMLKKGNYGFDDNHNLIFSLNCQYIDYDGTNFGTSKLGLQIASYDGTRPIINLPTMPLDFHKNIADLKARLIVRGAKVEDLAGSHYRSYNGIGWRFDMNGNKVKYVVKGRVVVDAYGFNRYNPNGTIFVKRLAAKKLPTANGAIIANGISGDVDHEDYLSQISSTQGINGDGSEENDYHEGYEGQEGIPDDGFFDDEEEEATKRVALSEDQKMICTPLVRGYSLKEKQWLNLFVNGVSDIEFNDTAFESLVLPQNEKNLILGFTSTQQKARGSFDDVIAGKGRGIIVLLCGPPGVGKTLTAESVAEKMNVPLYMLTAGDLGYDPTSVEIKLQGILELCSRWNAILLLDEADVFLEERSLHELERNKLVTIFLRVLEYYEGILFMTTNRVQSFDLAFQSRIDISLNYPDLDIKSRKLVWRNFLAKHNEAQATAREHPPKPSVSAAKASSPGKPKTKELLTDEEKELHSQQTLPHSLKESDITKLSQLKVNGRQIKNCLKLARLIASQKNESLSYQHVEDVMSATQHLLNQTQETERTKSSVFN